MKESLDFLSTAVLLAGFIWAIWKFGLFREKSSFLQIGIRTQIIDYASSLALVLVIVRLENLGNTRINARTTHRTENGLLYDDAWDKCSYAGTLKVRRIPSSKKLRHFDWYSLRSFDLEQINFLDEYQDPENKYREVHFWLEPKEKYDLSVFLWLPSGSYAAKAFFLSDQTKHKEEEYWSQTTLFSVARQGKRHVSN